MNIVWFIDFFLPHYPGGGQVRLCELAKRLIKRGHSITVVTMRHPNTPDFEQLDGIAIHHIGPVILNPPQRALKDFLHFFLAIKHWLATHQYDIVCAEGASLLPTYLFSKKTVIATIHDLASSEKDQWIGLTLLSGIAEKILLRLPYKKIITVSAAMKETLISKGIVEKKIEVIPNSADYETISLIKTKKMPNNTLIFIGRLIPHKHADHIITALKKVRESAPNTTLLIFGQGPEEQRLRTLATKLGLDTAVTFHPNSTTENIIRTLKGATLLALPSTREGFGIVLAEAAACSKPAIAYDIPAVHEVLQHKKTGFIIDKTPDALAHAILHLLQHPKKATRMGKQAREYITKTYSWDKSANKLEEIFNTYY